MIAEYCGIIIPQDPGTQALGGLTNIYMGAGVGRPAVVYLDQGRVEASGRIQVSHLGILVRETQQKRPTKYN